MAGTAVGAAIPVASGGWDCKIRDSM